jgi:hypothetical protein
LDFPDRCIDECAINSRVVEEVVHAPVLPGSVAHGSIIAVPEAPLPPRESFPETVVDVSEDLDDVHESLGSMGVRVDAGESDDDLEVLFPD